MRAGVALAFVLVGCSGSEVGTAAGTPLRGFDGQVVDSESADWTAESPEQAVNEPLALADEAQQPAAANDGVWINPEFIFDVPIDRTPTITDFEPLVRETVEPVSVSSECPRPELFEAWHGSEVLAARWHGQLAEFTIGVEAVSVEEVSPNDVRQVHDLSARCVVGDATWSTDARAIRGVGTTQVVTASSGGVETRSAVLIRENIVATVTVSVSDSAASVGLDDSLADEINNLTLDDFVQRVSDTLAQAPTEPEILAAELPGRVFTPTQAAFADTLDEFFEEGRPDWINPDFALSAIPEGLEGVVERGLEIDGFTTLVRDGCSDPEVAAMRNNSISVSWGGRSDSLTFSVWSQSRGDGDGELIDRAHSLVRECWHAFDAEGVSVNERQIPGVGIEDVSVRDSGSWTVVLNRSNIAVTITALTSDDSNLSLEQGREFDELVLHIFEALQNAPSEPEIFAHTLR